MTPAPSHARPDAGFAKRSYVRGMFTAIAPRYDFLNHLLSLSSDRWWRWRAIRRVRHVLRPGARAGRLLEAVPERERRLVVLVQAAAGLAVEAHASFGRSSRTRTALPCERGTSPGFFTSTSVVTPIMDLI